MRYCSSLCVLKQILTNVFTCIISMLECQVCLLDYLMEFHFHQIPHTIILVTSIRMCCMHNSDRLTYMYVYVYLII